MKSNRQQKREGNTAASCKVNIDIFIYLPPFHVNISPAF